MAATPRAHEPWEHDEYAQLVEELVVGVDLAEIAEAHGRSRTAITSKIADLVPRDAGVRPRTADRLAWLRAQLGSGALDWQQALRENSDSSNPYWPPDDDAHLREAWRAGQPGLEELAARFGTSELAIVYRYLRINVAESLVEVTDRLSFKPDGAVAKRRSIALDAAASAVFVLVIVSDGSVQVSVHESLSAAKRARTQREATLAPGTHQWVIAERYVGGIERGIERAGISEVSSADRTGATEGPTVVVTHGDSLTDDEPSVDSEGAMSSAKGSPAAFRLSKGLSRILAQLRRRRSQ